MEKVESALDVLSRAATMVQPSPAYAASDSDAFESPSTGSESESERTVSPAAADGPRPVGKWRRERRAHRLPDYTPKESSKMALRSQSFNERRLGAAGLQPRAPHSDGDLSEEDTANQLHSASPPAYPGPRHEAPIDMRLRRAALPPYKRPCVEAPGESTLGSVSMCDPVIDEHFRRSLGDNYLKLFKKSAESIQTCVPSKPPTKDRASSPIQFASERENKPTKTIAMEVEDASLSVDDHFAKALGDTWKQIQSSRQSKEKQAKNKGIVDDHFRKALGETWQKIQSAKHNCPEEGNPKDQTKIISRSGVVI